MTERHRQQIGVAHVSINGAMVARYRLGMISVEELSPVARGTEAPRPGPRDT